MKSFVGWVIIGFFGCQTLVGQNIRLRVDSEGIPISYMPTVEITAKAPSLAALRAWERRQQRKQRLEYNVKKVYPLAKEAAQIYAQINKEAEKLKTKKERDAYLKYREKELFKTWEEPLKNLTISQGKLLILLIDRQTQTSTYDIIKDLKSWRSAFLWQTVARLFGSNLKSKYDPNGEHREIEEIIQDIEMG
jgi:hypothetical protein